jgi:hypothetical protein
MTRSRTTPAAWLRREVPSLFTRRRARRNEDDGPPDPARWLDQLDHWLERKLPPPRGPLAELLVLAIRLALGRGSWVLGALLVAMSAPFFVFPYRQAETMVKAAFYRATATGRAEARVERAGVRLLPVMDEGGLRGEPYVVLAFEPEPGETVRVRYLPHGAGLESFNQAWLDSRLLVAPPAWASGWRFRWVDPATGEPAIEVNVHPDDVAFVNLPSTWNGESYYDNAVTDLDLPLDWLMAEWRRGPDDDLVLPVRFPPGNPERIFVGDALSRLPPTLGSGWWELFGSCVVALPFGLPFWWFGTRLLAAPLPRRWRHVLFWGPLALLPLWGTRYLEVVERLSPGASENVLARKLGSTQVLPGAEPADALEGPRTVLDLGTSRFALLLARVDLARPPRPLGSEDAVWKELAARFTAATATLPDAELEQVLAEESRAFAPYHRGAVAAVLVETARRAALDGARSPETRELARNFLLQILEDDWPPLCSAGYAAKRATLDGLDSFPDGQVATAAAARFEEERGWIESRRRDWGKVCP